jgi:large subunit ribosomal protein L18e
MKVRDKNPVLGDIIEELDRMGKEKPFWKALAVALNRPRRKSYRVNLLRIDKYAKKNDTVVVPGAVLSMGELKKPVTVVALKFSRAAEERIKKAGGKCMFISEFMKGDPKTSGVKIIG